MSKVKTLSVDFWSEGLYNKKTLPGCVSEELWCRSGQKRPPDWIVFANKTHPNWRPMLTFIHISNLGGYLPGQECPAE